MGQLATNNFVGQIRKLVEILVATGNQAEAEKIRAQSITVIDVPQLQNAVSDAKQEISERKPNQFSSGPGAGSLKTTYSSFDQPSDHPEDATPSGQIDFENVSLEETLKIYGSLSKRTVVHGPLPSADKKINIRSGAPLTRIQSLQFFDTALAENGIVMILMGDNAVKAVPTASVTNENLPEVALPWNQLPDSSSPMSRTVQLKNVRAIDTVPALQPFAKLPGAITCIQDPNLLILRDYSSSIRQQLKLLESLDQKQTPGH
jgi:hypothetical protein